MSDTEKVEAVADLLKLIGYPFRIHILNSFSDNLPERSPKEVSVTLGSGLGLTAYHMRILAEGGALELVRTEPRRGAEEHFYQMTSKGHYLKSVVQKALLVPAMWR